MKHQLAVLVILNVSLIRAGEPADLIRELESFKGTAPITAKVHLQSWREKTLKKTPTVMQGSLSLAVAQNAQGLQTSLASRFVEQAARESLSVTSDSVPEPPIRWLLKDLDYGRIHHLLDQEEVLKGLVASSQFVEVKAETWEGQTVRTIEFTFKPRLTPEESRRLNHAEGHLALMVNAEGLPLQSEIKVVYEGKTSRMFGRYLGTKRTETRYKVLMDHLIVSERTVDDYRSEEDGSDITKTRQIYSVTPG